jgi:hypothetical protein
VTSPRPSALTGAGALRPDVLATQMADRELVAPLSAAPTTTAPAAATTSTPTTTSPNPATAPVDVVRDFYATVAADPRNALAMMGSSLADLDPTGFVRSWSSVKAVRPERIEAQPDGTVLGVLGIPQADGRWLHVEQLLRVDGGNQPKIIDARILSAQQG